MMEVIYDPVLNCYYDPKTNSYYELKAWVNLQTKHTHI